MFKTSVMDARERESTVTPTVYLSEASGDQGELHETIPTSSEDGSTGHHSSQEPASLITVAIVK